MNYRYKKRLLRVVYYLTSLVGIGYLYVEAAHRNLLPAVFEYYTGDLVRTQTAELYGAAAFRADEKTTSSPRYTSNWYNVLDTLTREPGYLAAMNLLEHNLRVWDNLPRNINRKELLLGIAGDATLVQWLRNPGSRFADVYQYEFLYRMDSYRYISGYRIANHTGRDLYRSRAFDDTAVPLATGTLTLQKKGFSIPITDESRLLGYLQGNWDPAWFPDLPSAAANQAGFLSFTLTSAGFLSNPGVEYGNIQTYLTEIENRKKYNGPLSGRIDGQRFVSASIDGLTMVVMFKAAGWTFYVFQILLFLAAGVVAWLSYVIIARLSAHLRKQPVVRRSVWLEQDLKSSYTLQQNSLELLNESARHLSDTRRRESDALAWIAARLDSMGQGAPQPVLVAEPAPAAVISKSVPAETSTGKTEVRPPQTQPERISLSKANERYQAPALPEPEILTAETDDSITVIDEISPAADVTSPLLPVVIDEQLPTAPAIRAEENASASEKETLSDDEPEPYRDELELMFADIFSDISDELEEEDFDELLGNLDTASPVKAPEPAPVAQSLAIVDEEPVITREVTSLPEMKNSILTFTENLERGSWELQESQTSWELHDDEDFDILGIDGPLAPLVAPKPAVSEPVTEMADELVLFEDDDLDDFIIPQPVSKPLPEAELISSVAPAKSETVMETENKSGPVRGSSFQYRIKPEILSFESKEKPLFIREKLDPQQTILILAEHEDQED